MKSKKDESMISRKDFIRKMGLTSGAALLSPFLDKIIGEAWGYTNTKKRFIIYMHGTAMWPNFVRTNGTGSQFTLPYALEPLNPYKNELNVLRNVYTSVYRNLHGSMYGVLSGFPCLGPPASDNEAYLQARPGAATIDTLLSNELGVGTPHKEMVLGYCRPGQTCLSYGADSVKTPVMNLTSAFETYFSGKQTTSDSESLRNVSVLDFAREDIKRANRGLVGTEKEKFQRFLAAINEIHTRTKVPPAPASGYENYRLPSVGTRGDGVSYPTRHRYNNLNGMEWRTTSGFVGNSYVQADMIALAVASGVTRHATLVSQLGELHQHYIDLGLDISVHEDIAHGIIKNDSTSINRGREIIRYHASVVAKIYKGLKEIPEGNGTAADNTVILWLSDCGGSHHNGHYDGTAFLIGNAGGALKTGQSFDYGYKQYSVAQLLFTISKAIGSQIARVGNGADKGNTVIPGLLT
jgi:hypothetical protein